MPPINESKQAEDISDLRVNVGKIETKIESMEIMIMTLVTRTEFTPIKLIVYGLVGSIMAGVLGAILSQVIRK